MEIKTYTLIELAQLEGKSRQTIKTSFRYIPIKIETKSGITRAKKGLQEKSYSIKYVKLDDIKKLLKDKVEIHYIAK